MKLVIETDIGHDPDDFFAITYLLAAGVDIAAILIMPGDVDQIAIARLICERLGLTIPIGAAKESDRYSSGSVHYDLLEHFGKPKQRRADGLSQSLLTRMNLKDTDLFIIGPPTGIGRYLLSNGCPFKRATMQGGFVPYSVYRPSVTLDKFEGKEWMPSFNPNGDRKATDAFLHAPFQRRIVGKNVCHTIEFNAKRFERFKATNEASELFCLGARLYLHTHESKKFHDPTAAVCYLHPEIGLWHNGNMIKQEGGWTTTSHGSDELLVDIDRDKLWSYLETFT